MRDVAAAAKAPPPSAPVEWDGLLRRHEVGERYLASRWLDPAVLVERDAVRFNARGDVCVTLRALTIGDAIVNVVRRRVAATEGPKVLGLRECGTSGTLVGNVDAIARDSVAVVCEGVFDALTAAIAWPHAVVCGAHGAIRLADVAAEVAARAVNVGATMLLVVDDDETGTTSGIAAARAAVAAGLRWRHDLEVVDLDGAKDLNAAWMAGWRP